MIRSRLYLLVLVFLASGLPAAVTELAAQEAEEALSLEEQYFERDLEQSSLDELRIWCRSLSLDDGGNENQLKERLRAYYAYEKSAAGTGSKSANQDSKLEIHIESADSTEYYQIDDKGDEIHLTGKVKITVKDNGEDRDYTITADQIVFSRLDDSLTALGNVEYSRAEGGGEAERFLGESMTFHIEGWQGVIYDGVSSRTDSVGGKDIEFYFTGEEISSSGFDLAVMEKGTITSGKWKDPEYSIRAGKIWLNGPEEWGLVNGVLYLGRIPLLYLPFYYKPGNEIFCNPSLGFRNREGTTIQTTTYLIGQKDPENTSFFSAGLNSDATYELERRGFFLFKGDKEEEEEDGYLKFMADYYSRLGGFIGLEGEVTPGESTRPVDLFTGIAVSRSIDDGNNYSVFYSEDNYQSRWNSSHIGGLELPFRWGSEVSYSAGSFSLSLMYYSDPHFMGEFTDNRVENFDPLNFVLSDLGEDNTDTSSSTISSFTWSLNWRKNIATEALDPWFDGFNITRFKSSLEWASIKDVENDDEDSPTIKFFYPESITLPDTALSLSGTIWKSGSDGEDNLKAADTGRWLFPEEGDGAESYEAEHGNSAAYLSPDIRSSRTISEENSFSGNFKWSSTTTAIMLNDFDNFLSDASQDAATPSDISFFLDKGKFSLTNKDTLSLDLDFFDDRLTLSNAHNFSISARKYLSLTGENVDLTDSERKDQYSYESVKWNNSSTLKGSPFSYYSLKGSYVKYTLGLDLFEKTYQTMNGSSPVFNELWLADNGDGISQSDLEGYLSFKPVSYFSGSSRYKTALYTDGRDVTTSLDSSLSLTLGPLSNSLSHGLEKSGDDDWESDPLQYKGTLDFDPLDLTFSDSLTYDIEESRFSANTATLKGYGFTFILDADYTYGYDWDLVNYLWVREEQSFQLSSASAAYSLDWDVPKFWKSRVDAELNLKTGWSQNLIKINDSVLDFSLGSTLSVHEFMDLSFAMVSSNENMYLYIPRYREDLGLSGRYNFFEDLGKSFNFFNTQDRYDSFFNLSSFKVNLTHYLGNWNFVLDYTGSPTLVEKRYEWESEFSFYLTWDPVPTLNIDVVKDSDDDWDIKAGETD